MSQLEQQLKRMNEKLQQLLKQYHSVQKENERLKHEFQQMTTRFNAASVESENGSNKQKFWNYPKSRWTTQKKKRSRKGSIQYVKEIDRCIALLNE